MSLPVVKITNPTPHSPHTPPTLTSHIHPGLIAGHEPSGIIVDAHESGMKRFKTGDRVVVYHVSGCGICNDCRRGIMNSCTSPSRKAYGWQRHGGMAPFMAVEEKDLLHLPDQLSFIDGAIVACSMGTVYEALCKISISGNDQVLVVGLGPVGMAAAMLAKALGASSVVGVDTDESRCLLGAKHCSTALQIFPGGPEGSSLRAVVERSDGLKGFEKVIDCSGSASGRALGIAATRKFGSMVLVGEGGPMTMSDVSNQLIHDQKTLVGSWVSSTWRMEELLERLVRWGIHPEDLVTHRYPLSDVSSAYRTMADGKCGKVAVVFDE